MRRDRPPPEIAAARFRFNGWAKYPDHRKDDRVAERAAKALGLKLRPAVHEGRPVVLEGGAIDAELFTDRPVVGIIPYGATFGGLALTP